MFEDVAQMEKEIEVFRSNIIASSELVSGIEGLTESINQQKESFSASSELLVKKLDSCIEQFKSDHDASLQELTSSNSASIESLRQGVFDDMQQWILKLENIKDSIVSCETEATKKNEEHINYVASEVERIVSSAEQFVADMKKTVSTEKDAFTERLSQTELALQTYQADAETKYNSFVQKLESTNMDQIYKEMQDLKKSIQTIFFILMVSIGVTLATVILSIIIK